jgi:trehalose-6-phosphatase
MPVRERKRSTHCDSQISLEERLNIQNEFWNKVRQSPVSTLLLDYDGTLAPFTADRDAAFPHKGVVEALNAILESCRTRVVVVTGRRAHDIPRLLRLRTAPEVWGCHGYEYLTSGKYELKKPDEDLLRTLSIVDEELENEGLADRIEYKPGAVAVHFRGIDPEVVGEQWQQWCVCTKNMAAIAACNFDDLIKASNFVCRTWIKAVLCTPWSPRSRLIRLSPTLVMTRPTKTRFAHFHAMA